MKIWIAYLKVAHISFIVRGSFSSPGAKALGRSGGRIVDFKTSGKTPDTAK